MTALQIITVIIGWIISISGVGAVMGALVNKRIDSNSNRQEEMQIRQHATEKGVQALLRAQIISIYNKYMDMGSIPIYERENIEHLYTEYKALGGNGVIESLMDKLTDLPTPRKKDENADE